MSRVIRGLTGLVLGYAAAAVLGYFAVMLLSSNTHDKSLEAAMTAAFVAGPLGAVVGLVAGLLRRRRETL